MEYSYSEIARDITTLIEMAIAPLLGTPEAQELAGESAGGGFTRRIDRAAEDAVIEYLEKDALEYMLITEESGIRGEGDVTIILDPLDGTTNALTGIPFYSVSVAISGKERYGLVKNLCTHDIYEAFANAVPLKNGKDMHQGCSESIASMYIGEGFRKVLPLVEAWRCFGSLALEISYVVEGKLQALVDLRKKARIVDIAAAAIIAEAGGYTLTDEQGRPLFTEGFFDESGHFRGECVVCAYPELHKKIIEALTFE
ncbi:MAG: inositol monophosphatase family protein [Candidatus Methanofastidiosia archaeon]